MTTTTPTTVRAAFFDRFLPALAVPAFRWLWASHSLYATSLLMGRLASGWLVLDLTDSPFWVGLAAGLEGLGKVGFGIFAGVLVDRLNKRSVFIAAQLLSAAGVLALGVLVLTGHIALWHLLVVGVTQGAADALMSPAGNAMVYQIVGRTRVMNASAATMFSFNLARIVGSALAGGLIARWGVGQCFAVAGITACVAVLPALRIRGQFRVPTQAEPFLRALAGGLAYAWANAPIRQLLLLSVVVELFGFSHYSLIPVIARDVLHVGPVQLGFLSAAGGVGALLGTIAVASLGDYKQKGGLLLIVTGGAGLALLGLAGSSWYAAALLLAILAGMCLVAYDVLMHALFQLLAADSVRGRVFSLYVLTFGFSPLGGFLMGTIATIASAPLAVGVGGGFIVAYVIGALRSVRQIRPMVEEAAVAESH